MGARSECSYIIRWYVGFFGGNYVAAGGSDESSESEEASVALGKLDDGAHLLDQATISLETDWPLKVLATGVWAK
jgi:hypothetical protein